MLKIFRKKCICGMKEEKGTGVTENNKWFCCEACFKEYKTKNQKATKSDCCCH